MSHEAIDKFKYNALLGKLENMKGKNLPIHKFVKEVYELSNHLKTSNREFTPQPETIIHAFMLINKAANYLVSKRPLNMDITYCIDNAVPPQLILNPLLKCFKCFRNF